MGTPAPAMARSTWPHATASLGFAALSFVLGGLYSKLHWKVLFVGGRLRECVDSPSFTAAVQVLDSLWLVKIVAAAGALVVGIWGLVLCRPRWPSIVATGLAAIVLSLATMIE